MQFTVYFESPFWVGVLEVERDGILYAARHIFGSEPTNQTVYEFVRDELNDLYACLTVGVALKPARVHRKNPKRIQRELRRELVQPGTTTKAHEAIRQQIEQNKHIRHAEQKAAREAERARRFKQKQDKAKKRHRGH